VRNCAALVIDEAVVRRIISFFFLWLIVTDTDPGWSEAAFGSTHPVTTDIVDHTREYRISALGNSHVIQREQKIWLVTVHWNIQQYTIIIDNTGISWYIIKSRKVSPQQIEKKIAGIIVPKCFYNLVSPQKSRDIKLFFFYFLIVCRVRHRSVNKFILVWYKQYVILLDHSKVV